MNLQNNKDRDRSVPGFGKPENNLAKDSSETTREAFNSYFTEYKKHKLHRQQLSGANLVGGLGVNRDGVLSKEEHDFLEWFIGFTEGDGSFIIANAETAKPRLFFIINQIERKVLNKVAEGLGFGKVISYTQTIKQGKKEIKKQYYRYSATSFYDLTSLIHIFNGNIITGKVQTRFKRWLAAYNLLAKVTSGTSSSILFRQSSPTFTLQSAWFAGFVDAEGGFYAKLSVPTPKTPERLRFKFYITQQNGRLILENIRDSLQLSITKTRPSGHAKAIITRGDISFLELATPAIFLQLFKYFANYGLRGRKRLVFLRWKFVFENRDLIKNVADPDKLRRFKRVIKNIQITNY